MNAILNAASITGQIGAGSIVLNDYALNITPLDRGYRLTVTRGSEVQTMDIMDGPQGIQGPQGEKGETGAQGPQGPQGEPGQDAPQDVVRYAVQSLDTDQQMQARENIGAADSEMVNGLKDDVAAITPDDNAVDGKPWTSGKIVEALCPPFETTGSIVQCHPVEHYPLGVVSRIDATQSGTGDPSPDNIRPIVGWDSVSLNRCGKNISKSNAIGSVAWAGTDANTTKLINSLPAGTYRISFTMTLNKFSDKFISETIPADGLFASYRIYDSANNQLIKSIQLGKRQSIYRTDTLPISASVSADIVISEAEMKYKKIIYFYGCGRDTYAEGAPNGALGTVSVSNLQIEFGSTATPYEPYTSDTYTAELPETIYGGELDWNTGVLTVTQKHYALPISEMNNSEEYPGWQNVEWVLDLVNDGVDSILKLNACNISTIVRANTKDGIKTIYFIKSVFGGLTQTEIKETYPDLMLEFVAYLLTPYTIQLTPQQIAALPGVNTLYTDSGDTTVSGRTDPVWLTQSLMDRIAALESAATNI